MQAMQTHNYKQFSYTIDNLIDTSADTEVLESNRIYIYWMNEWVHMGFVATGL